jgi:hypothetical protein
MEVAEREAEGPIDRAGHLQADGRRIQIGDLEMVTHVEAGIWHHDAARERRNGGFAVERMRSVDDQSRLDGLLGTTASPWIVTPCSWTFGRLR